MLATSVILGLWLVLSPFFFGFAGAALWTTFILGAVVALLALLTNLGKGRFYAIAAIGLYFVISAFFAGGGALLWNGLIVGAILAYVGYQAGSPQKELQPQQPHH